MRQLQLRLPGPGVMLLIAVSFGIAAMSHADEARRKPRSQSLVPLPREVSAPPDNPTTPDKVALGRQLFFDPRLSGDNKMSCATCHLPAQAFGDGLARAKGLG